MAEEEKTFDRTNRGSLWKVPPEERTEEWHAPYKGTFVDEDGNEYYCDLWGKRPEGHPQRPDITFRVKRKDAQTTNPKQAPVVETFEPDDSIPF